MRTYPFQVAFITQLLLFVVLIPGAASAQTLPRIEKRDPFSNKKVTEVIPLADLKVATGVGSLSKSSALSLANRIVSEYGPSFALDTTRAKIRFSDPVVDKLGSQHVRGVQTMAGYPVYGSQFDLHVNDKRGEVFVNTKLSTGALQSSPIQLSSQKAIATVSKLWKEIYSTEPKHILKPTLLVFDASLSSLPLTGAPEVAYQVDISDEVTSERYFISASTGAVLDKLSLTTDLTRTVSDCSFGDGACYSGAYSSFYDYVFGRTEGQSAVGANPINLAVIQAYPVDTDMVYDVMGAYHSYMTQVFGRNGANGLGGMGNGSVNPFTSSVAFTYTNWRAGATCPGASFEPVLGRINFCAGLATSDIVAHEITHALTTYTAGLEYRGESGALNESFSDILAETAERYFWGSNNWLLGSTAYERTSVVGNVRSMADPEAALYNPYYQTDTNGNQPARFHSAKYYCGAEDYGGVHTNSGVLNHAAYLIAKGGTFNGCSVKGIGVDKMEQILFRALTLYLGPKSNFFNAYVGILYATLDLYPAEDYLEVQKALQAVELNQNGFCSGVPASDTGCSTLVDHCPDHPNQIVANVCGCGIPEVDRNGNGQADCLDPTKKTKPEAPVVERLGKKKKKNSKAKYRVTLQAVPGAKYVVTLTPKRGRPITKTLRSNVIRVATVGNGWKLSYKIKMKKVLTRNSRKVRLK